MRVAAVQFAPMFKRPDVNVPALMAMVERAAAGGAQLVVLPELCTTGYGFMGPDEARPFGQDFRAAYEVGAPGAGGTTLQAFARLARRLTIALVFGFVEVDPGTGALYNSQAYLDYTGVAVRYQKVNFFGNDWLWATKGIASPPVVASPFEDKRVGLLICRDIRNKATKQTSFYGPGDADVVALSTAWGDGGFPATAWMDFVEDTKTALVVANRYGQEGPNNFGEGGVCVIHRDLQVECQGLVWEQDCLVFGEV